MPLLPKDEFLAYKLTPIPNPEEDQEDCPIHYDTPTRPVRTPCNHTFCAECLTHWLRTANTCPMCRAQFFASPDEVPFQGFVPPLVDVPFEDFGSEEGEFHPLDDDESVDDWDARLDRLDLPWRRRNAIHGRHNQDRDGRNSHNNDDDVNDSDDSYQGVGLFRLGNGSLANLNSFGNDEEVFDRNDSEQEDSDNANVYRAANSFSSDVEMEDTPEYHQDHDSLDRLVLRRLQRIELRLDPEVQDHDLEVQSADW